MKQLEQTKPPKRCQFDCCKMKLGLVPFACRCGNYYCSTHRFSDDHKCTYNYKEDHKKELLKYLSSPVIAPKVEIM